MNQPIEPLECLPAAARPAGRRPTRQVELRWGCACRENRGDAPVLVQSMTNTDTADAIATADPGQGTGAGRVRGRAHHGEFSGGRGRSGCDPRAARSHGHRRAADRRLPLQRAQAADAVSGVRAGAVEVPHQSGQRRQGRAPRGQLRTDDRSGLPQRQAGAHRCQLGLARPGTAGAHDGRERRARCSRGMPVPSCARRWCVRRSRMPSAPRNSDCRATASACRPRSAACRT